MLNTKTWKRLYLTSREAHICFPLTWKVGTIMLNFHWQYYCLWFCSFCFLFNKPQHFASSDASASGCGSVITRNEDCVCHKLWEPSECSKSSTWRERATIFFALESFGAAVDPTYSKWEDGLDQSACRLRRLANHAWSPFKFGRLMRPAYSWLFR